jgi:6-phosphogluconate dehydrogenase
MRLGMIGLGRMGAGLTARLVQHGHEVACFDPSDAAREAAKQPGVDVAVSLGELVSLLTPPRVAWVMVPAGPITDGTIDQLADLLEAGDVVIDGGNSHYRGSQEHAKRLAERGVGFVDAGVSGGIWGLKEGFCIMAGGDRAVVELCEPAFTDLVPPGGYKHVGPSGAGHYVKMVHNGIEYGLLQAYAEGFALMHVADDLELDISEIAELWRHGSVVRSWLLDLAALAFADGGDNLDAIAGRVADSGEGRWTVEESVKRGIAAPVIASSLYARFASRDEQNYAGKVIAALRHQFGGHAVEAPEEVTGSGSAPSEKTGPAPEQA